MAWLRWRKIKRTGRTHAYIAWKDEAGRERTKPLHTTDPDVAGALLREHQRAAGQVPSAVSASTAGAALEEYLAELRLKFRPATVDGYAEKLGTLVKAWSGTPMHLWTRSMFVAYVGGHGWSDRTAQMVTGYCTRWISWAKECDLPMPNFVGGFKPRAPRYVERPVLTPEDEAAITTASRGHYLELPLHLALYAGLSRADFRALDWSEVDLEAGLIRRARSKTGQLLEIPIRGRLRACLARRRALGGPVCRGLPASDGSLYKALHRLCVRAEVPAGGWHRFRHTFATRLVAAGADVPTVQRLMGHRPGSPVTLRYFHSDQGAMNAAVERAFGG